MSFEAWQVVIARHGCRGNLHILYLIPGKDSISKILRRLRRFACNDCQFITRHY